VETNFSILPYGGHIGAPKIDISDLQLSKHVELNKINHYFKSRFDELLNEYQNLLDSYNINEMITKSDYKFTPIVGETYYLYQRDNGSNFLSLIEPSTWNKKLVYKVKYNSNNVWGLINE
jgi:hypothetical protein